MDLAADQPLVSFTCSLPVGLGEEDPRDLVGEITFPSNPGVHFDLTHGEIARRLLIGLDTPPTVPARPFLDESGIIARFGGTRIFLSAEEAQQLCWCVDQIGRPYKAALEETTTALELWEYPPIRTANGIAGVVLCSLPAWLWERLLVFAQEHFWELGHTPWHCFEPRNSMLATGTQQTITHVELYPQWASAALVEIIYAYPAFSRIEGRRGKSWQEQLGPDGIWTAAWTEAWLRRELIPAALAAFPVSGERAIQTQRLINERPPHQSAFSAVAHPRHLVPYIEAIQSYCATFSRLYIAAGLVRPYYEAFIDLAKQAQLPSASLEYMAGKLGIKRNATAQDILWHLDLHRTRIRHAPAEAHGDLDLLSRIFLAWLKEDRFQPPVSAIRQAAEATQPLWELCRFEERFHSRP